MEVYLAILQVVELNHHSLYFRVPQILLVLLTQQLLKVLIYSEVNQVFLQQLINLQQLLNHHLVLLNFQQMLSLQHRQRDHKILEAFKHLDRKLKINLLNNLHFQTAQVEEVYFKLRNHL